jgi:hypothetical protein
MIPEKSLILISGIPASGKSSFAQNLATKCQFAHYDMENHPHGWPHPELKRIWDSSRERFVDELHERHPCVVLDWGFPCHCSCLVSELLECGVKLVWFEADGQQARLKYGERERRESSSYGSVDYSRFDRQYSDIRSYGLPSSLAQPYVAVSALAADGSSLDFETIVKLIFG